MIPVLRASDKAKAEMISETGLKMEAMLFRDLCLDALIKLLYIGKCTDAMGACIEVPHFLLAATFVDDTVAQIFPDTAPGSSSSKMHKVLHGLPQLHGDWVKAKIVAVHCLNLALQYHSANHADKKVSIPVYVDMQLIPYPSISKYVLDMQHEPFFTTSPGPSRRQRTGLPLAEFSLNPLL
jgi:hypothetical protein